MKQSNLVQLLTIFAGISGVFAVLFGAWLAHVGVHLPMEQQTRLATALQYQFIHTLALLMVVIWYKISPQRIVLLAGMCFLCGVLSFSGSLYVKTLLNMVWIGKLAPFGGISMALGWLVIAIAGIKR